MIKISDYLNEPMLFNEKAEIIKAIANPQRLCIIKKLCETDQLCVSDMKECLGEAQPNVSQHISKLKAVGIIKGNRNGKNIYYSLCENSSSEIVREVIKQLFNEEE